ncbi:MAG: alanine--tRNA ligase [Myxococcota bacterium]|nr:alanine--tRNA ligase [Myxococcota bacterium]
MSLNHRQIRRRFLDYFVNHPQLPHREVSSSPIIPPDDPTLLFTNAGMNQFKAALLGQEQRDYQRACSAQKCMRVGGKHNDLDAVGKNGRHLTWFEMLGNWSFGDYGKEETIKMAWALTVEGFDLDVERVYVSIYKDDEESFQIWRDTIGLDPKRIYRFGDLDRGDEENFWSMGPTGPCGPCTELFFDLGEAAGTSPEDVMGGEGDRFMEFWNNVFMQYNRDDSGVMTPLPALSVDTGMGLERIAMILQGKTSVFETDVFQPLIKEIAAQSGADWDNPSQRIDLQVIADHLRSLTFVLSEGGQFSNEGRGYVLRRILRRAVRHGRRLGFSGPFLGRFVPAVAEHFEGVYELPQNILSNTCEALTEEEARFFRTIDRGMGRIHAIMDQREAAGEKRLSGVEAFELYDTFGFPVDLSRIEAEERGFSVDEAGFEAEMEAQRSRSRDAARFYDDDGGEWIELSAGSGRGFAGYRLEQLPVKVQRYRQKGERVELILSETPFYAESGGEIADHGRLEGEGFELRIDDVQKLNGIIHHFGHCARPLMLSAESELIATVDTARRAEKTIHHTATHLLHAALKEIVGAHVEQKGSVVEPARLRFDFSHRAPLSEEELEQVERWVNTRIRRNELVDIQEGVPLEEARAQGAAALFGEKYGDEVRTIRAGSDSFELCGGNHVERTGDIGAFVITSQSGVAAGVRRIEAVVGHAAEALVREERGALRAICEQLKSNRERGLERVVALQDELKQLKKALEQAQRGGGGVDLEALLKRIELISGVPFLATEVSVSDRKALSGLMDALRERRPEGVFFLVGREEDKALLAAGLGHKLKKDKRLHAGKIIQQVAPLLDGRGGGRPDFAQGGGNNLQRLPEALQEAAACVTRQLEA